MSKFKVGQIVTFESAASFYEGTSIQKRDLWNKPWKIVGFTYAGSLASIERVGGEEKGSCYTTRLKPFEKPQPEEKPVTNFKVGDKFQIVEEQLVSLYRTAFNSCRELTSDTVLTISLIDKDGDLWAGINGDELCFARTLVKLAPVEQLPAGTLVTFKTDAFETCHRHKRLVAEGAHYNTVFEVVGPGYTDRSVFIRIAGRANANAHPVKVTRLVQLAPPAQDPVNEVAARSADFIVVDEDQRVHEDHKLPTLDKALDRAKHAAKLSTTTHYVYKLVAVVEQPAVPEPVVEMVNS